MVNAYSPHAMTIMPVKGLHRHESFGKEGALARAG
jgi:hypothetical protein